MGPFVFLIMRSIMTGVNTRNFIYLFILFFLQFLTRVSQESWFPDISGGWIILMFYTWTYNYCAIAKYKNTQFQVNVHAKCFSDLKEGNYDQKTKCIYIFSIKMWIYGHINNKNNSDALMCEKHCFIHLTYCCEFNLQQCITFDGLCVFYFKLHL